jgi:biuret amidohydrolase
MRLGVDRIVPAVIAIDLHRGHLDPAVATMPVAADAARRVVTANARFFHACRAANVPIIHCVTTYRDASEIRLNPAWRERSENPNNPRKNVLKHNIRGMPGCTLMAEVYDAARDHVVDAKKRYDCFIATDLELVLRARGINTVLVTGVNTNSCVLATATSACSRDFAVVVVEDCVDTMDAPELHAAALLCIRTAFGHVMPSADIFTRGVVETLVERPFALASDVAKRKTLT